MNDRFVATYLPLLPYNKWLEFLEYYKNALISQRVDPIIIFTSHPPVITMGRHAKQNHLLTNKNNCSQIPVFKTNRGGDVTYHDEGQLMLYPIIYTGRIKSVKALVKKLEYSVIHLLEFYGINSIRKESFPGGWTSEGKIASIGLNLEKGILSHGMALYVNTNKENFKCVVPCGIENVSIASMEDFLQETPSMGEIAAKWVEILAMLFKIDIKFVKPEKVKELKDVLEI